MVELSGIGVSSGTTTDIYVLQMSFTPSQLQGNSALANFEAGCLWLGTYNPSVGGISAVWTNAARADSSDGQYDQFDGIVTPGATGYNGSWASFWVNLQAMHPGAP